MDRGERTASLEALVVPFANLMLVQDDGIFLCHGVSQIYGLALLGAMALRMNGSKPVEVHVSYLAQEDDLTVDSLRDEIAPGDNFMFIDHGRRILSCRVRPERGVALLESLRRSSEGGLQRQEEKATQTGAVSDDGIGQGLMTESSRHASAPTNPSSFLYPPLGTSDAVANSNHRHDQQATLSDQILSDANRQPYDRDWMRKYNVGETYLDGWSSKHKLEVLLRYGAVKVGDRFCVTCRPDGGDAVVQVGEVLHSARTGRLDLCIAPARADSDGILHDCQGARDIIGGMHRNLGIKQPSRVTEAWKMVRVVAEDGREVGSLWKVRQAYQLFTEEMKQWGERNRRISP